MTKHLTSKELDWAQSRFAQGWSLQRIRDGLAKQRRGEGAPTVWNLRQALSGRTHRRGAPERRGRPKKITRMKLQALNKARKALQKKAAGQNEVTLSQIRHAARVQADDTTVARALKEELGVQWRAPRVKPQRTPEQDQARAQWCEERLSLTPNHWLKKVHMFIDCKKFQLPLTCRQKQISAQLKVRGEGCQNDT